MTKKESSQRLLSSPPVDFKSSRYQLAASWLRLLCMMTGSPLPRRRYSRSVLSSCLLLLSKTAVSPLLLGHLAPADRMLDSTLRGQHSQGGPLLRIRKPGLLGLPVKRTKVYLKGINTWHYYLPAGLFSC